MCLVQTGTEVFQNAGEGSWDDGENKPLELGKVSG